MNPILIIAALGGAYYLYTNSQKKKAASACTAISRYGMRTICANGQCVGIEVDPTLSEAERAAAHAQADASTKPIIDGLLAKGANATREDVRIAINQISASMFPECNWASLPETAKYGDVTIGQTVDMMYAVLQQAKLPTAGLATNPNPWMRNYFR